MLTKWGVLAGLALAAAPARADVYMTRDLLKDCGSPSSNQERFYECVGYINGVVDGFYRVEQEIYEQTNQRQGWLGMCLPADGLTVDAVIGKMRDHLGFFPQDTSKPARTIIGNALRELYPCKPAG